MTTLTATDNDGLTVSFEFSEDETVVGSALIRSFVEADERAKHIHGFHIAYDIPEHREVLQILGDKELSGSGEVSAFIEFPDNTIKLEKTQFKEDGSFEILFDLPVETIVGTYDISISDNSGVIDNITIEVTDKTPFGSKSETVEETLIVETPVIETPIMSEPTILNRRNFVKTSVAATGSGAIIGQTSSGIEPILYFVSKRDLRNVTEKKQEFKLTAPIVKKRNLDLDNLPEHAITAHDVAPEFRVKMQGTLQKYIDSSISSTVNLPEDVSVETVSQIYIDAYKNGLKGITVYREGSREGVIRNAKKESTLERKTKVDWHPSLKIGFDNEDYVFSKKYEIATPEGPLHVSFTTDDRGFPIEVFANIGPLGSTKSSNIAVSGLRDSRYLQQTEDPNILQMVKDFGSVKGDKSSGFGESKIDSWQHGYSIILKQHAESFGIIGKDEHGFLTQKVHKKRGEGDKIYLEKNGNGHKVHEGDLKGEGEEDNVCTKCGGRMSIPKEGGCKTLSCPDCGAGGCD